jgi:DNA-binding protein YbaB
VSEFDLSGLRAYAQEMTAQFTTLRDGIAGLQQELRDLTVVEKSTDGLVTVTVGARGQLVDLALDPRVYRRPDSTALARSITQTVQKAAEAAAVRVSEISEKHAPGVDAGSYLRGDLAKRLERFGFVEDQVLKGTGNG